MELILILVLPFAGSLVAALLPSNARNVEAWLAGLAALTGAILAGLQFPRVMNGGVVSISVPWIPLLDVDLALRMDGYA